MTGGVRENMTGKQGGVYNVANGTLYFLNNSAGKKKYEPRNEEQMVEEVPTHQVENYWGLFSGKFGQTGEPTFSKLTVTTDTISVVTYTVDGNGKATEFDSFKVVKEATPTAVTAATAKGVSIDADDNGNIVVKGIEPEMLELYDLGGAFRARVAGSRTLNVSGVGTGTYLIKAKVAGKAFTKKLML